MLGPAALYAAACEECEWTFEHRDEAAVARLTMNHVKIHEGHTAFYEALERAQEAK
jgi:hypothetical protein